MKRAFLFPGQGAQAVGMGKDVFDACPEAAAVYKNAGEILGYDIAELCFAGPAEKLDTTTYSQPAIFVTSAALLEVFKKHAVGQNIKADVTGGLSLGEYTALYAAGAISFEDGLRLVAKRGAAMQDAAQKSEGSMVSVLGLDAEKVKALCEKASEGELLVPANFNCPGQVVISGTKKACERAEKLAAEFGAIKAIVLRVAGAFHCSMMSPAAEALGMALKDTKINMPAQAKVIANVKADYYGSGEEVRSGLAKQLIEPVLWQNCCEKLLADGVDEFYEIGPGKVLTGLMKKVSRRTNIVNISTLASFSELK